MPNRTIAAVEAGGTKFILALADEAGTLLERSRIDTAAPDVTLPAAVRFFAEASARHGRIAGFGIGSFGPIETDPRSPDYARFKPNPKPGWAGASFAEAFAGFDAPIVLDTDVNAAALGEWLHGAGQGCETVAYTTVGTGIGSGILRGGEPVGGFAPPETGHIPVPHDRGEDDFDGVCPFHGDCLEGLASGPAIAARWGAQLASGQEGYEQRVGLIARYLASLATTLILLHTPDRLIFGGGVMKAPGLLDALRRETEARLAGYVTHPRLDPGLRTYIAAPDLGDEAGIRGAIALGRRALKPA